MSKMTMQELVKELNKEMNANYTVDTDNEVLVEAVKALSNSSIEEYSEEYYESGAYDDGEDGFYKLELSETEEREQKMLLTLANKMIVDSSKEINKAMTNEYVKQLLENVSITKLQDPLYVTNEMLRDAHKYLTGKAISKKVNRTNIIKAVFNYLGEETPIVETKTVEEVVVPVKFTTTEEPVVEIPAVTVPVAPILSDEIAKKILVLALEKAHENKVKCFISDYMLTSVINRIVHGKYSVEYDNYTKQCVPNVFTAAQIAATNEIKGLMIDKFLVAHGKGYKVRAYYMAWRYGKSVMTYRFIYKDKAKGFVDYAVDVKAKTITNKKSGTKLDLTRENCALLDVENVIFISM